MTKANKMVMGLTTLVAFGVLACGGGGGDAGQSSGQAAQSQPAAGAAGGQMQATMSVPDWMKVDNAAKTVALDITAGQTDANNHWNFNGHHNGDATVTVPQGYKVTINFHNADPAMAHSIGISDVTSNFPAMFNNPTPVFAGAISKNPTDPAKATQPGKTETVTFTADKAGNYSMLCYIPAHALSGMWVHFAVSADGKAGVSM